MSEIKIAWHEEVRKLSDLKLYENNPRTVPKDQFKALIENIQEVGFTNRLLITTDNLVLGGNQRLKALKKLGFKEINVLVPDRDLTLDEIERINITDNLSAGNWDFDILGNLFDAEKLIDWGMPPLMLGKSHYDVSDEDEKPKSRAKEKKPIECPNCGELF